MNVLISGDGDSIFIKGYIEKVLLDRNTNVILITDDLKNKKWIEFYKRNNIEIINKKVKIPVLKNIPILRGIINQILLIIKLRKKRSFSTIHVHFVSKSKCFFLPYLRKMTNNIVLTYWGSDLLRRTDKEIRQMKKYVDLADKITFSTNKLRSKFEAVFGEEYSHKLSIVKFGSDNFEAIDKVKSNETLEESKNVLGLPNDKIIIVCGYNRNKKQQQLEILKQISLLQDSIIEKMCIVYPMTYGPKDNEYEKQLKELNSTLKCEIIYLYDYMFAEDIARLCRSTDIFIHAQVTDAFSATVQEFLYAGSILINGGWLDYSEFDLHNIDYIKFDRFEQLKTILEDTINNLQNVKYSMNKNRNKILELSSWEANRNKWLSVVGYFSDRNQTTKKNY